MEDGAGNGAVEWVDAPPERIMQAGRISPYPCDFVTAEEEKKFFNGTMRVSATLSSWWDSITPAPTANGACTSVSIGGSIQYKIGSSFESPIYGLANPQATCTLQR